MRWRSDETKVTTRQEGTGHHNILPLMQIVCVPAQTECDVRGNSRHHDLVVRVLEDEADRAIRARGAGARRQLPAQRAQQRGLAAAVGAQQDVQAAARHGQARAAQHLANRFVKRFGMVGGPVCGASRGPQQVAPVLGCKLLT